MFWHTLWRPNKAFWQRAGFSVSKPDKDWLLTFRYTDPSRKAAAIAESKAVIASGDVPAPTGLMYYEYQKAGIEFLARHAGALLADDCGLGKTIQVAGLLNLCPDIRSVLIVPPAGVKYVWQRELTRWLVDSSRSVSVAGRSFDPGADMQNRQLRSFVEVWGRSQIAKIRSAQGARHTYCSCWLRQHGDINKLVLQAGHESATVLWNHYYQAVSPEAAAAFWAIYPPEREEHRIVAFPT